MDEQFVYTITAEIGWVKEDNVSDIVDDNFGVIRVFLNKQDALDYMKRHYDNCALEKANITIHEAKAGMLKVIIDIYDDAKTESYKGRYYHECIKCCTHVLSEKSDNKNNVNDDIFETFYE